MKSIIVFVALVGACFASPVKVHRQPFSLQEDIRELFDMIPLGEILEICDRFLLDDASFSRVVYYLQSPQFAGVVKELQAHPHWNEFKAFIDSKGMDSAVILEALFDLIDNADPRGTGNLGGLPALLDEIKVIVPYMELLIKLGELVIRSEDFRDLYEYISSEESHKFVDEVRSWDEVERALQELTWMGVDVDGAFYYIYQFLGWM